MRSTPNPPDFVRGPDLPGVTLGWPLGRSGDGPADRRCDRRHPPLRRLRSRGQAPDALDPQFVERAEISLATVAGVERVEEIQLRWMGYAVHADIAISVPGMLD